MALSWAGVTVTQSRIVQAPTPDQVRHAAKNGGSVELKVDYYADCLCLEGCVTLRLDNIRCGDHPEGGVVFNGDYVCVSDAYQPNGEGAVVMTDMGSCQMKLGPNGEVLEFRITIETVMSQL
ncbi:MAG: hypothetical protein WAQ25_01220 [Candidatus Saccharimonas sp.]